MVSREIAVALDQREHAQPLPQRARVIIEAYRPQTAHAVLIDEIIDRGGYVRFWVHNAGW